MEYCFLVFFLNFESKIWGIGCPGGPDKGEGEGEANQTRGNSERPIRETQFSPKNTNSFGSIIKKSNLSQEFSRAIPAKAVFVAHTLDRILFMSMWM